MAYSKNIGMYMPTNKQKYKGNINKITYRSNLEKYYFNYMDLNPQVLEWNSEEVIVPYISPVDNTHHRYYIDLWVKVKTKNGKLKQVLIEIKPSNECDLPKMPESGLTAGYKKACLTYLVNQKKWEYARNYAEKHNMTFQILTEKDK